MNLFACQHCGQLLDFANTHCERCGSALGFLPRQATLTALVPADEGRWQPLAHPSELQRFCANAQHGVCNWLVADDAPGTFCAACRLNRTIPNLNSPDNLLKWQRLERAKHRLVYGLLRLGLLLESKRDDPKLGLAFDFLDARISPVESTKQVLTGHAQGVITINIAEADDVERERRRQSFAEPYRTLLGHMRHEIGHYYWYRLVRNGAWIDRVRAVFGDDREPYGERLAAHHASGPPPDWRERFITAYASAHPLEDWAETWAHYLHLVDTLETAYAFGIALEPKAGDDPAWSIRVDANPYEGMGFDDLVQAWIPLTFAANSLNRSMGQPDLYPFVLRRSVIDKLRLVHDFIQAAREAPPSA